MDDTTESPADLSVELVEQREELTEHLRTRLIECGWRDQVAVMCRKIIEERGVDQVKMSDILGEVKAEARNQVPQSVKNETLAQIRKLRQELAKEPTTSSSDK